MKFLFAPWRSKYAKSAESKKETTTSKECVFCQQLNENNDEEYFILKRFKYCFIALNKFPYNAGHLLILPLQHQSSLSTLSAQGRIEMMELVTQSTQIVQEVLECEGVNIGLNLGKAAGAGIPSHLHMHVLPRWLADTNFMPALSETKVISFDLSQIYKQLKPYFEKL
jgi:ATP adenylyltransferase